MIEGEIMAKKNSIPTNIAQAMQCAAKIERGQACSMAELKATVRLLKTGLSAARSGARMAKSNLKKAEDMVRQLISR
tara:strand:+ start:344 stop:574 length:231 start_codon:yes stop_codon:yes gene_type:complete